MIDQKRVRELCARLIKANDDEFRRLVVELAELLEHLEPSRKPTKKDGEKGAGAS